MSEISRYSASTPLPRWQPGQHSSPRSPGEAESGNTSYSAVSGDPANQAISEGTAPSDRSIPRSSPAANQRRPRRPRRRTQRSFDLRRSTEGANNAHDPAGAQGPGVAAPIAGPLGHLSGRPTADAASQPHPLSAPLADQGVQHLRVGRTPDGQIMVQLRVKERGHTVDALIQETAGQRVTIRLSGEIEDRLLERVTASLEDQGHAVALGTDADPPPHHKANAPDDALKRRPGKARRPGAPDGLHAAAGTDARALASLPTPKSGRVNYRS